MYASRIFPGIPPETVLKGLLEVLTNFTSFTTNCPTNSTLKFCRGSFRNFTNNFCYDYSHNFSPGTLLRSLQVFVYLKQTLPTFLSNSHFSIVRKLRYILEIASEISKVLENSYRRLQVILEIR